MGRQNHQIAQIVVDDGFGGFADKGLDQQGLGFLLGQAARTQVEQQALIERACWASFSDKPRARR